MRAHAIIFEIVLVPHSLYLISFNTRFFFLIFSWLFLLVDFAFIKILFLLFYMSISFPHWLPAPTFPSTNLTLDAQTFFNSAAYGVGQVVFCDTLHTSIIIIIALAFYSPIGALTACKRTTHTHIHTYTHISDLEFFHLLLGKALAWRWAPTHRTVWPASGATTRSLHI